MLYLLDNIDLLQHWKLFAALITNNNGSNDAESGIDYKPLSKTLIFSGATKDFAKTCRVEIIDDDHTERQETFVVSIWNSNLHIDPEHQKATIIIIDDDGMYINLWSGMILPCKIWT